MKVQRATAQRHQTLYDFYAEHASEVGEPMLALLVRVETLADEVPFWGLTSHTHLHLLAEDNAASPRYVTVVGGRDGYYISYLLPDRQAPWNDAHVECVALDLDSAFRMLAIAMRRSSGWSAAPVVDGGGLKSISPFELNNRSRTWTPPQRLASSGELSARFGAMLEANAADYWVREEGAQTLRLLIDIERLGDAVAIWGSIPADSAEPNVLLEPHAAVGRPYAMVRCGVVEFSMPEATAPYPGADIGGTFAERGVSEEETHRRLLIAMRECGGWPAEALR